MVRGVNLIALAVAALPAALALHSSKAAKPAGGGVSTPEARAGAAAGAKEGTCQLHGITVPGFNVTKLPAAQFNALHAAVAPRGESERWKEIPWESDLWTAKQRAAREGKPLLMWVMDGNPLGCT
jgi:hypothetical protein